MSLAYYLTFTQVRVDPDTPSFRWRLSDDGRANTLRETRAPWTSKIARIVTPDETRALDTAEIFARRLCVPFEVNTGLRDLDRAQTDYFSVEELASALSAFFAQPDESARPGWETANHAEARVAEAFRAEIDRRTDLGDVLFVGHGAVGTLLLCHLAGLPIAREHFEPTHGGNLFAYDRNSRKLRFGWRSAAAA